MGRRIFAIVGTHRSGTSYIARLAEALGADLGPQDELMPAHAHNPLGFWENVSIVRLHDELLATLGGSWSSPPTLHDGWEQSPALDDFRGRALDIVDATFGDSEVAVWKDPRGSLLLPFWGTVTGLSGTVICLRHPADVASSLAMRDGIDSEQSADLWLRYTVAAYRAIDARLLVRYDEAIENCEPVASRIADFLDVPPSQWSTRELRGVTDPDLRHHRNTPTPSGPLMATAAAIFDLLIADSTAIRPLMEIAHERWLLAADLDRVRGKLDHLDGVRDALRLQVAEQLSELEDSRTVIERQRVDLGRLKTEVEEIRRDADVSRQDAAALRASTSWRITAPMRAVADWPKRLPRPRVIWSR